MYRFIHWNLLVFSVLHRAAHSIQRRGHVIPAQLMQWYHLNNTEG